MSTRPLLLPALLSVTLLVACGDDGNDTAAPPAASPTSSASPEPGLSPPAPTGSPSDAEADAPTGGEPQFRADRSPDTATGERAGNGLSVVDVRVGEHEGFDRVVFELGGEGTAGWRVQYDDDPRTEGEGAPVELDGDATLTVVLDGIGYPFEVGVEEYAGPRRFAPALSSVREVQLNGVFEGYFDAYVGVAEERPFRVFRLDSPQRVVVDVAYGD
jgi:hypothetical protein